MLYQLNNISYRYDDRLVLDIPSLVLEAKKSYAILGENGSGKSTLLNLLALLNPLQEGTLKFSGQLVNKDNHQAIRHRLAYVQQKPYLFNSSVYDNIELPLKLRGINSANRKQKTNDIIKQFSLQNLITRNAKEISGGEVQKVALARALISEPELLILDEPFSHLDVSAKKEFETWLIKLKQQQDVTLIFSIHDPLKAHVLADEVFQLRDGHLLNSNVMNLFSGEINREQNTFNTGLIKIKLPEQHDNGVHAAIDARQIVLSKQQIVSSMQNEFKGKVISVNEYQGQILVSLNAGEVFQCIITHQALKELGLHPGDEAWLYFKSSILKIV